ncbi:hypothetical protein PoB_002131200 [Plakobranchus ocellatus]|uniref:Uncharacterized protein n=1 Tax=Plakobranchus ocellatus TaxID=259542 RepID=A0AAV3ZJT9_9GAST|nr:hypothetical protein PoB_002131200 [Plakobranchus ocellatus]
MGLVIVQNYKDFVFWCTVDMPVDMAETLHKELFCHPFAWVGKAVCTGRSTKNHVGLKLFSWENKAGWRAVPNGVDDPKHGDSLTTLMGDKLGDLLHS